MTAPIASSFNFDDRNLDSYAMHMDSSLFWCLGCLWSLTFHFHDLVYDYCSNSFCVVKEIKLEIEDDKGTIFFYLLSFCPLNVYLQHPWTNLNACCKSNKENKIKDFDLSYLYKLDRKLGNKVTWNTWLLVIGVIYMITLKINRAKGCQKAIQVHRSYCGH